MKTLEQILAGNNSNNVNRDGLSKIIIKTQELKHLHNLFCRFLSADLIEHCHLAKIEGNKLHVVVDSAVWGVRLRYSIPDILKNLRLQPEFKKIEKIEYHIDVESPVPVSKSKKSKPSDASEKLWRQVIADLKLFCRTKTL